MRKYIISFLSCNCLSICVFSDGCLGAENLHKRSSQVDEATFKYEFKNIITEAIHDVCDYLLSISLIKDDPTNTNVKEYKKSVKEYNDAIKNVYYDTEFLFDSKIKSEWEQLQKKYNVSSSDVDPFQLKDINFNMSDLQTIITDLHVLVEPEAYDFPKIEDQDAVKILSALSIHVFSAILDNVYNTLTRLVDSDTGESININTEEMLTLYLKNKIKINEIKNKIASYEKEFSGKIRFKHTSKVITIEKNNFQAILKFVECIENFFGDIERSVQDKTLKQNLQESLNHVNGYLQSDTQIENKENVDTTETEHSKENVDITEAKHSKEKGEKHKKHKKHKSFSSKSNKSHNNLHVKS